MKIEITKRNLFNMPSEAILKAENFYFVWRLANSENDRDELDVYENNNFQGCLWWTEDDNPGWNPLKLAENMATKIINKEI